MSDTDNKQEALNKELEAKFKQYNSSDAKSASPRKTIQKALVAYAKAGQKCREAIEAVEGYKEVVKNQPTYLDIDEVDKKLHPDQSEKLYNELVHQPYSGDNNEYHIWRYNELSAKAGGKPKTKSSSGAAPLNLAADSVKPIAEAILSAAASGMHVMGELVTKAATHIHEKDYKKILPKSERPTVDDIKKKVKQVAGRMSGTTAKGYSKLSKKQKIENDKGKYKVVDTDIE